VFWERTVAGFIEDTVRVRPTYLFALGLRYYFQNRFHNDPNNLAPRLSFAFAPSTKSRTVFRGGAGFFFDRSGPLQSPTFSTSTEAIFLGCCFHFNPAESSRSRSCRRI
jgi:hypothetical protein